MKTMTLTLSDVRRRLTTVIAELREPVFISERGKVTAVLLNIDAYNKLVGRDAPPAVVAADAAHAAAIQGADEAGLPRDHLRDERG